MGPFPHDAPKAEIDEQNPAGTDGFEFVEFAHPQPSKLRELFTRMGYSHTATHGSKAIELWQQGDITYVLNDEPDSHARIFVGDHGPCAPSMAWRVVDANHAVRHAVARGAVQYDGPGKTMDVPAIRGIGGSLIYFIEDYYDKNPYNTEFEWVDKAHPEGVGFYYLDHLTHNVRKGNMDTWFRFYGDIFNFREIRFFDIEGRFSGLFSRALTSPCGRIRIPINESRDDKSQIEEYLKDYGGEGIQHIACGCRDIYASVARLEANGLDFMPAPPATYYERIDERLPGHGEPIEALERFGLLIDGEAAIDADNNEGGLTKVLLQVFSKTVIGPIFFEFIQRKGDEGFGEGNFKALFESIEEDQIRRGVF